MSKYEKGEVVLGCVTGIEKYGIYNFNIYIYWSVIKY